MVSTRKTEVMAALAQTHSAVMLEIGFLIAECRII